MHDVAVNCVRSKDAQKQLARTYLSYRKMTYHVFNRKTFITTVSLLFYHLHVQVKAPLMNIWVTEQFLPPFIT